MGFERRAIATVPGDAVRLLSHHTVGYVSIRGEINSCPDVRPIAMGVEEASFHSLQRALHPATGERRIFVAYPNGVAYRSLIGAVDSGSQNQPFVDGYGQQMVRPGVSPGSPM